MPRTGSLLLGDERAQFGTWLRRAREHSGKSKSELAKALRADSTARINMYLNDNRIPTAKVVVRLAIALNVSVVGGLLFAGYYREVLGVIAWMSTLPEEPPGLFGFREEAVGVALAAFPLDGSVVNLAEQLAQERLVWAMEGVFNENEGLDRPYLALRHPMLRYAVEELGKEDVPVLLRRKLSALFVHEWAREVSPETAAMYSAGFGPEAQSTRRVWLIPPTDKGAKKT